VKTIINRNRDSIIFVIMLILITCVGGFLRFYQIGKLSFWVDEVATVFDIRGNFKTFVEKLSSLANMRFYYILAYFWTKLFPNASDGTLRALSAIFSTATIPVVFLLGKEMAADKPKANTLGLVAAFLTAINAFHVQYAQEFRSYSLTLLLTLLSTLMLIKLFESEETKTKWVIWYVLITAAAVYSHMHAVFILAAHAASLLVLLSDKQKILRKLPTFLLSCLAIAVLLTPMAITALQKGAILKWISAPTLATINRFFVSISGYKGNALIILFLLFGLVGFLFGSGLLLRQELVYKWKIFLITFCFLLPILIAFIISAAITPIFVNRYLMYVIPYMTILTAYGILVPAFIRENIKITRFITMPIMIVIFSVFTLFASKGLVQYYDSFRKEEWRQVADLLTTKCSDSYRIYYPEWIGKGILYYNPLLEPQTNPFINYQNSGDLGDDKSSHSIFQSEEQVCLVLSHIKTRQIRVEESEEIKKSLEQEYSNVDTYKYYEVVVEIYSN